MELPSVPTDELPDVPESSEKTAGVMSSRVKRSSFASSALSATHGLTLQTLFDHLGAPQGSQLRRTLNSPGKSCDQDNDEKKATVGSWKAARFGPSRQNGCKGISILASCRHRVSDLKYYKQ